jgi:hypothetical protein
MVCGGERFGLLDIAVEFAASHTVDTRHSYAFFPIHFYLKIRLINGNASIGGDACNSKNDVGVENDDMNEVCFLRLVFLAQASLGAVPFVPLLVLV